MSGKALCPCTAHPSPQTSSATWKTLSWLPMLTEHTRKASLHPQFLAYMPEVP